MIRILLILLLAHQVSFAQSWADTLSIIEKTFDQYRPKNPGCQLSVSRNGETIFSKAWGMADMERNAPLSRISILEAGSVSKQFTAAAVLLLEQQGKLSLDDDVRKYVPELPKYATSIRLRHMLHHTSGLRDWGSVAELAGWPRGTKFYSNDDALEIIARQKHLNNKPGDEYIYSNSNYNLFAIIVQRVSGLSLAAFTQKYIFEPAGMTNTQWRDDPNRVVKNRAIAYSKTDTGFETHMANEYVYGNGGLLTTTDDLLKWSNFYQKGKFGSPSLLGRQTQTDPLNNGVMNTYAAGLIVQENMGWNTISHGGATAGYRAYLETFSDLGLTFAILSNTSEFNIQEVANNVSKIFIKNKQNESVKNEPTFDMPQAQLAKFAGMYNNRRDGSTFTLEVKDKKLTLDNNLILEVASNNSFKAGGFDFEFHGANILVTPNSRIDSLHFIKVTPVKVRPEDFTVYEGKYFSDESNSAAGVVRDGDKLMLRLKNGQNFHLISTYKDAFKVPDLDCNIQFTRDSKNRIVAMKMSVTRARNVEFKKIM